jgi:hypothetical protein
MSEVERGKFISIENHLNGVEEYVPFWRLDGWVYRGAYCNDWRHAQTEHAKIPWWNVKEYFRWRKFIRLGYTTCTDLQCDYCGKSVPVDVLNRISDARKKDGE